MLFRSEGQRVGTLTLKAGEETLRELPLVAARQVDRLTYGQIFTRVLRKAAMAKDPV